MKTMWCGMLVGVVLIGSVTAQTPELLATLRSPVTLDYFGWFICPLGDINRDGYADFSIGDLNSRNRIFLGGPVVDTLPALYFDSVNIELSALGDVNGDGFADFGGMGRSPYKKKYNLYYGSATIDTLRDTWYGADTVRIFLGMRGHDINHSGTDELIGMEFSNREVVIFEMTQPWDSLPDLFIRPQWPTLNFSFGQGISASDFSGDGFDDLAISLLPPAHDSLNGAVFLYFGGPDFDTLPDLILSRPGIYQAGYETFGQHVINVGDINGDGWQDLFVSGRSSFDSVCFLYYGGPGFDSVPDRFLWVNAERVHAAGDLNGDGYPDIVTSRNYDYMINQGFVRIFFGGPTNDSLPDIAYENWSYPDVQTKFGQDCAGLGDINGDTVNDFAFSYVDSHGRGTVVIYSGTGTYTEVGEPRQPVFPSSYHLFDPYPNPFNATLSIPFTLDERQHVTIEVCNALGQKVATLIDKEMAAGEAKVTWRAEGASSGVYFVRMRGEGAEHDSAGSGQTQVKRVVMVK